MQQANTSIRGSSRIRGNAAEAIRKASELFRLEEEQRMEDLNALSSTQDDQGHFDREAESFDMTEGSIRNFTGFSISVSIFNVGRARNCKYGGARSCNSRVWKGKKILFLLVLKARHSANIFKKLSFFCISCRNILKQSQHIRGLGSPHCQYSTILACFSADCPIDKASAFAIWNRLSYC